MEDNQEKIDLTKVFDRIFKAIMRLKLWLFLVVIICIGFFEVKTVMFFNTVYSSKAVFLASSKENTSVYIQSDENNDMLASFNNVITGTMMRDVIKTELNVDAVPGNISVQKVTDTNLIELTVTSSNAQDAYDVINCIINNYTQITSIVMSDMTMSVLDTPKLATAPDETPNYIQSALKGTVYGCIIDIAILFIYVLVRHTVSSNEDVKNILHLSSITKIPLIGGSRKGYKKVADLLITNPGMQYRFKQAFHDIRLRIEQENKKNDTKVIMVTSTMPNEGKSMVSSNVAISLSQKGHKVILIDLDLRNPSIISTLREKELSGNIVGYLKGDFAIEEIINKYKNTSLDVIYGVTSSTESTELLSKDKFKELIEYLKKQYDYIILDVPPLYMMEDAHIIAKNSDSALVVIKQDFVHVYDILDSLEELNENIPYIMGTVLNQVRPSLFDSEQGHYGYGYGYGYGNK